jgi:hypothetical protein
MDSRDNPRIKSGDGHDDFSVACLGGWIVSCIGERSHPVSELDF